MDRHETVSQSSVDCPKCLKVKEYWHRCEEHRHEPHRRANHEYRLRDVDRARWLEKGRQFVRQHTKRYNRRGFLAHLVSTASMVELYLIANERPSLRTHQRDYDRRLLAQFKDEIRCGNIASVRNRLLAFFPFIQDEAGRDGEQHHLAMEGMALLRDCGLPGDSAEEIQALHTLAAPLKCYYTARAEFLHAAHAVLAHANLFRVDIDRPDASPATKDSNYASAMSLLDIAEYLLAKRYKGDDQESVLHLRHQLLGLRFKLVAFSAKDLQRARPILSDLKAITSDIASKPIASPWIWWETLRNEAGYYQQNRDMMTAKELSAQATHVLPSSAPAEAKLRQQGSIIELAIAAGEVDEAQQHVAKYVTLWNQHPNAFNNRMLKSWKNCGLKIETQQLREPNTTAILTSFYLQPALIRIGEL